jgi:hypothetical protein
VPYGIYDIAADTGWVNVGTDADTAAFAVASIRRWWNAAGREAYPHADRLLITADAGGSNGYRTRAWKTELAALATETGLTITVCHLPPGTSKWNKIEHRLFRHITTNWRGRPLSSHEVIVATIAATTTRTGLRVHAALDTSRYPTGVKVSDAQMAALTRADARGARSPRDDLSSSTTFTTVQRRWERRAAPNLLPRLPPTTSACHQRIDLSRARSPRCPLRPWARGVCPLSAGRTRTRALTAEATWSTDLASAQALATAAPRDRVAPSPATSPSDPVTCRSGIPLASLTMTRSAPCHHARTPGTSPTPAPRAVRPHTPYLPYMDTLRHPAALPGKPDSYNDLRYAHAA